jgi:hypothetical protein
MYQSAIAAAGVVLEQRLICLLETRSVKGADRMSIGQMLRLMKEQKLMSAARLSRLLKVAELRNRSVHARPEPGPTRADTEFVLANVRQFLESSASADCP